MQKLPLFIGRSSSFHFNSELLFSFALQENTCFIGGRCYGNNEVDPNNKLCRVCDPSRSSAMFLIGNGKDFIYAVSTLHDYLQYSLTLFWVFRDRQHSKVINPKIWISFYFHISEKTINCRGKFLLFPIYYITLQKCLFNS